MINFAQMFNFFDLVTFFLLRSSSTFFQWKVMCIFFILMVSLEGVGRGKKFPLDTKCRKQTVIDSIEWLYQRVVKARSKMGLFVNSWVVSQAPLPQFYEVSVDALSRRIRYLFSHPLVVVWISRVDNKKQATFVCQV